MSDTIFSRASRWMPLPTLAGWEVGNDPALSSKPDPVTIDTFPGSPAVCCLREAASAKAGRELHSFSVGTHAARFVEPHGHSPGNPSSRPSGDISRRMPGRIHHGKARAFCCRVKFNLVGSAYSCSSDSSRAIAVLMRIRYRNRAPRAKFAG